MNELIQQLDPRGLAAIAIKTTAVLACAWVFTKMLRRSSAVTRHTVWLSAIVGAVVIPVLAWLGPIEIPVLAPVTAVIVAPASPELAGAPTAFDAGAHSAQTDSVPRPQWTTAKLIATIWLGVALALIARMLIGMATVRRLVGRARPAPAWHGTVAAASNQLGISAFPRIVVSDEVDVAFTCNAIGPTIVLPTAADEWPSDLRQAVLAHELAHIKRRDLFGQLAANIACAMYWFNPLVWGAAQRLRTESELASDDIVLASGVRPADYAQHLLNLVTTLRQGAPTAAIAVVRPRELEGRLIAILDRAHLRTTLGSAPRRAIVAALGAFTVSIATVTPVPRVALQRQPVTSVSPAKQQVVVTAGATSAENPRTGYPPRLSDAGESALLRAGTGALINPMQVILRYADTLQLTGAQADSIATLGRTYSMALDKIWRPVLRYYASHAVEDERPSDDILNGAHLSSLTLLLEIAPGINSLLSSEQRGRLPDYARQWIDARQLSGLRDRARATPDVAFDLPRRSGARMGGGGVTRRPGPGRAG